MSNWRLEGSVGWIMREKRKKGGGIRKAKGTQVWLLARCNEGGWKGKQSSEGGIMKGKNDGCVKVSRGGCRTNLGITSKLLRKSPDLVDSMPRGLLGNRNILLKVACCRVRVMSGPDDHTVIVLVFLKPILKCSFVLWFSRKFLSLFFSPGAVFTITTKQVWDF